MSDRGSVAAHTGAPDDLSIVTFADFPWHSVHQPPLTSMRRPHEQVCDLIVAHPRAGGRDGAERRIVRLAPRLTERASVAPRGPGRFR